MSVSDAEERVRGRLNWLDLAESADDPSAVKWKRRGL